MYVVSEVGKSQKGQPMEGLAVGIERGRGTNLSKSEREGRLGPLKSLLNWGGECRPNTTVSQPL